MRHLAAVLALGTVVASPCFAAGARSVPREAAPLPQTSAKEGPPQLEYAPTISSAAGPIPIGGESDIYCSGWLGGIYEPFVGSLISAELIDSKHSFFEGDIVYVNIGAERGADAGQEYWICRPEGVVYGMKDEIDPYGRMYATPGRLRILCAQEKTSIAEIIATCSDVVMGDALLPFEPIPVPLVRRTRPLTSCDPPSDKLLGRVLRARDGATPIGVDSVVYLDLGDANGIAPGDFLTVYRPRTDVRGLRTILGEVAILTTRARSAVARVTSMREVIGRGDFVELK